MAKKYSFVVIYNPSSGVQMPLKDFKKILYKTYPPSKYPSKIIEIKPGINLPALLKAASKKSKNFVICGGDGTIRETVQELIDVPDTVFTVIPMGTFNHFAQSIGQSMNIEEALKAIKQQKVQKVDVAKVNDLYFLNVSSIGLYTQITKDKEKLRKKGSGRMGAILIATLRTIRRSRPVEINAKVKNIVIHRKSSLVFVGNNRYHFSKEKIGMRTTLRDHQLHFFLVKGDGLLKLFKLVFHYSRGTLKEQEEFDEYLTDELTIRSSQKSTFVTVDGEVYNLDFPLKYVILPDTLKVKTFSA